MGHVGDAMPRRGRWWMLNVGAKEEVRGAVFTIWAPRTTPRIPWSKGHTTNEKNRYYRSEFILTALPFNSVFRQVRNPTRRSYLQNSVGGLLAPPPDGITFRTSTICEPFISAYIVMRSLREVALVLGIVEPRERQTTMVCSLGKASI